MRDALQKAVSGSDLPRTLIITPNRVGEDSGSGIWLQELFRDWPSDKLAQIYTKERPVRNNAVIANNFCGRTGMSLLKRWRAGNLYSDRDFAGCISIDGAITYRLPDSLVKWVEAFRPQIVYGFLGPVWITRLTVEIARRWRCGLISHIMDDYVSTWPVSGVGWRSWVPGVTLLNRINRRVFNWALRACNTRFVCSPAMQEEYAMRYGVKAEVVQIGVNPRDWPAERKPAVTTGKLRVVYAGSVSQAVNASAIYKFAQAVEGVARSGRLIEFELYVPSHCLAEVRRLSRFSSTTIRPAVGRDDIKSLLVGADLLLLPFNKNRQSVQFTRLSWPTKIAEYMASGTPSLALGSADCPFLRYLIDGKVVFWEDGGSVAATEETLLWILNNPNERQLVGRRGQLLAFEKHLSSEAADRFRSEFVQLAQRYADD